MDRVNKPPANIDAYISAFPEEIQTLLESVRQTIREAAPEAEETISYQIPTFKLHGNLVHFAAFKKHIGFYPTSSGIRIFQDELADYEISKGTIRFPFDKPLPLDLIDKIVRFRIKENLEKKSKKK